MMWKPSSQAKTINPITQLRLEAQVDQDREVTENVVKNITDFNAVTPEELVVHNEMLTNCAVGDPNAQAYVKNLIKNELMTQGISGDESARITKLIYERHYGLGPIEDLFQDETISEIWVNGAEHIWIERNGFKHRIDRRFVDDDDVIRVIRLMLQFDHQEVTRQRPYAESRMADGSRITVIVPDMAKRPYINIRKFESFPVSEESLLQFGTLNQEIVEWLKVAIKGRSNVLLIGETSSGKTSFLQFLVELMDPKLRLGSVETKFELKLDEKFPERNIFSYEMHEEFDITMSTLFKVCLRSSPDIIIVGEARGQEADDLIRGMRRGHPGSCSTIHTNSPETAVDDLADMVNQDGQRRDPLQLKHRIASAIDLIIQIHRYEDGVRRIVRISEIQADSDSLKHEIRDIFAYEMEKDSPKGSFKRVGDISAELAKKWSMYGVTEREIASVAYKGGDGLCKVS